MPKLSLTFLTGQTCGRQFNAVVMPAPVLVIKEKEQAASQTASVPKHLHSREMGGEWERNFGYLLESAQNVGGIRTTDRTCTVSR
jgi:hypothetical protein